MPPQISLRWAIVSLMAVSIAQSNTLCGWTSSRTGTVRDALYIDGGIAANDTGRQWEPLGSIYKFNYSTPFDYTGSQLNMMELLESMSLTSTGATYDAPPYRGGAMFVDDFELYTYG